MPNIKIKVKTDIDYVSILRTMTNIKYQESRSMPDIKY